MVNRLFDYVTTEVAIKPHSALLLLIYVLITYASLFVLVAIDLQTGEVSFQCAAGR